jgi:hypothetical protein
MQWFFGAVGLCVGAGLIVIFTQHGVINLDSFYRVPDEVPVFEFPTYLSFIGTMLTAVTAILAALAIFIGVVAAFTIKEIKEIANDAVKEARAIAEAAKIEAEIGRREAMEQVEKQLSEGAFDKRVAAYIAKQRRQTVAELEEDFDPEDTGNR